MPFYKILLVSMLILSLCLAGCQSSAAPADDAPEPAVPENQVTTDEPEQEEEPQEEMSFLNCPSNGESLVLGFDHAVTIEQPDVNLTHILKEGYLPSLDYEMMGVMGPCSVTMAGIMQVSASGTCNDGVVYLTIIETWQSANGSMTCDDDVIPFSSPGPGSFTHEGADGAGEVFYLVDSSEGYTVMRPFGEGSGYHSWTLYAAQIPLVPLVP